MAYYLTPIKISAILFPVLAILLTVPYAIFQYRTYGYINKLRTLIIFSFLFYIITAYYLVILPVPKDRDVLSSQSQDIEYYNLRPFRFIEDISQETRVDINQPKTYPRLLGERAFLQVIFNIFLTLPLGIYLRYYFGLNLGYSLLVSLLISLFFEFTQLSGLYGIYNAPYRIFDLDDLILNTSGGLLGYLLAPALTFFLPSAKNLDQGVDLEQMKVGYFRRGLAFGMDLFILGLIPGLKTSPALRYLVYLAYFVGFCYLSQGRTLGGYITMTQIKGKGLRPSLREIFLRNFSLVFGLLEVNRFFSLLVETNSQGENFRLAGIFALIHMGYLLFMGLHLIFTIIKGDDFFYEKISGSKLVISKKTKR